MVIFCSTFSYLIALGDQEILVIGLSLFMSNVPSRENGEHWRAFIPYGIAMHLYVYLSPST